MTTLPSGFISRAAGIVGGPFVLQDTSSLNTYGTDGTKKGAPADLVVLPGSTAEVSQLARLCNEERVPIVVPAAPAPDIPAAPCLPAAESCFRSSG